MIGQEGYLVKKDFLADKKSTAYSIKKRFKLPSGIVFYENLKTGRNKAKFNDIDMFGGQRVVGSGRTFDVLVFFDHVQPSLHQ